MTPEPSHLHVVPDAPATVVAIMSPDQVRELRRFEERFGVELGDEPIETRSVELNAAMIGCVEEAAAELRRQGFRLLPGMLDRVAARYHEAAPSERPVGWWSFDDEGPAA
jgi:hypothetical protein